MGILSFLSDDHRHCDALFADAETAVSDARWADAASDFAQFLTRMRHHFAMEEQVLFPAFESATGMTMGPTQVMRSEHTQMNAVLDAMQAALSQQKATAYLDQGETLLMLMSQHNLKEEQILYPMCSRHLNDAALVARMQELA
jgi:iron-sulfur cluster repair protein YtfE (RIC family)